MSRAGDFECQVQVGLRAAIGLNECLVEAFHRIKTESLFAYNARGMRMGDTDTTAQIRMNVQVQYTEVLRRRGSNLRSEKLQAIQRTEATRLGKTAVCTIFVEIVSPWIPYRVQLRRKSVAIGKRIVETGKKCCS